LTAAITVFFVFIEWKKKTSKCCYCCDETTLQPLGHGDTMVDIGGGFLAFCHGQFCEGRRHTRKWRHPMSAGMAGFWLSAIDNIACSGFYRAALMTLV
jgi:hypothetical protein